MCENCIHKAVCAHKEDYAHLVGTLPKSFIPIFTIEAKCKHFSSQQVFYPLQTGSAVPKFMQEPPR